MPDQPQGRPDSGRGPEHGPVPEGSAFMPGASSEGASKPTNPGPADDQADPGSSSSGSSSPDSRPNEGSAPAPPSRRRRRGSRGGRGRSTRRAVAGDAGDQSAPTDGPVTRKGRGNRSAPAPGIDPAAGEPVVDEGGTRARATPPTVEDPSGGGS